MSTHRIVRGWSWWWCLALVASLGMLASCSLKGGSGKVSKREFQEFQRDVYPVLLRDCAFSTCHGDPKRFFRVFGPGRRRMASASGVVPEAFDLPTADEIATTYQLALSMIDDADLGHSRLLQKPLAIAAGGSGHNGVDKYGRDVYRTAQDSGYLVLARWVYSPAPEAKP
jgi:hypothetical protein